MSQVEHLSNFTSNALEQEILNRFRNLVKIIPSDCKIFRESWGTSTVLCLDFSCCPYQLEIVKENSAVLTKTLQEMAISKSIIFRNGNQVKALRHIFSTKNN